ncbi:MAG: hypothetical protein AB7K24_12445 [Gemmataceae bacterium]
MATTLLPRATGPVAYVFARPLVSRRILGRPMQRTADAGLPVPGVSRDLRVKIASSAVEWEQALRLVTDNYQARGYETGNQGELRFTAQHALPDARLLVAKEGERVVATMSLFMDNVLLGLPMESIYGQEIKSLRAQGKRICEVGSLAETSLGLQDFVHVFIALIRLAWQHHLHLGGDSAVIAVNPRHRAFYTKVLGFTPLGGCRPLPTVKNHPAEAYYLDPQMMQVKSPAMYERVFNDLLPAAALASRPLSAQRVRHFAARSTQTDRRLVEELLRYVADCGSPRRW